MTLRVLFVINGLGTGGAERSIAEMIPGLRQAGLTPAVACLKRRANGVEQAVIDGGTEVFFLEGSRVAQVLQLRRLVRMMRPDILHTSLFDASVAGRLAAAGLPTPVLTSLVNTSYARARLSDPSVRAGTLRVVQVVDSLTARGLTRHFHAITNTVKEAAVRDLRLRPDSVTVIERGRNPVRLGDPHPERRKHAREALGLAPDAEVVVNVGRQEYQKGQVDLLRATAELRTSHPRLVVLIAGREGDATPELRRLRAELGIDECVQYLGHREDVPDILAAADVFAFPSLYEGLGCAVIEAMALALPIVATDIPALREVLEPGANAVMVAPNAPSELAAGMAAVLADPSRSQRYGARSRAIFEERFTIDRSTARMADLYAAVARQAVPTSPTRPGRLR